MSRYPDFMIIGAMKSATSTLHEQLARQPGFFMCTPKEPYFFSDDPVFAKGLDWYTSLFAEAQADELCGESTTHYTKLPTHPKTIERIHAHVPDAKFIYIMRHPIERLVSQYIHHWTELEVTEPINESVRKHEKLIAYSQYSRQLQPYFDTFGQDRVLPVFFDRLRTHSQSELERICRFLGYAEHPVWDESDQNRNVSADRMQPSRLRDMLVYAPGISQIREYLIPPSVRNRIKEYWQMRKRPTLTPETESYLEGVFNADLGVLGGWLGVDLTCANFKAVTRDQSLEWVQTDVVSA